MVPIFRYLANRLVAWIFNSVRSISGNVHEWIWMWVYGLHQLSDTSNEYNMYATRNCKYVFKCQIYHNAKGERFWLAICGDQHRSITDILWWKWKIYVHQNNVLMLDRSPPLSLCNAAYQRMIFKLWVSGLLQPRSRAITVESIFPLLTLRTLFSLGQPVIFLWYSNKKVEPHLTTKSFFSAEDTIQND